MSRKYFSLYILIVVFYCTNVSAVWRINEDRYSNQILNRLHAEINNRYIHLPVAEVAKRAQQPETAISHCFKQEFLTAPSENEPISNERKNREIMHLLQDEYHKPETSEFKVAITELKEDIAIDLDNKEKDLTTQLNGYSIPKIMAVGGIVAGLIVVVVGPSQVRDKYDKRVVGGLGVGIAAVSGGYLYSLSGQSELIKTNIAEVRLIKENWEKF